MFYLVKSVRKVLLAVILFGVTQGFSQSGPGGVANNTTNRFWFDVVDLNLNNGQRVQNWNNKGGNPENLYQTLYAKSPIFKSTSSSLINGFPSVKFDGMDDVLRIKDNPDLNLTSPPDEDRSYSFVFKTGNDVSSRQNIYDEGGNKRGINMYIYNDSLYVGAWNLKAADGPDAPWGFYFSKAKIETNKPYVVTIIFEGNSSKTGTIRTYLNNNLFGTINNVGRLYPHDVGAGYGNIKGKTRFEPPTNVVNGTRGFKGSVTEWMFYTYALNEAERNIVENYLAGKFDIPFTTNLYTQRTFHQHQIIGIGKANDGTSHTQSSGRSILTISNPDSLDNGDYLFAGHDNGVLDYSRSCPEGLSRRLERIWRVTEVSEVGNITIEFDLSAFDELPTDPSEFILLTDSDGNFTNATSKAVATSINGSTVKFENVDLDWGDFFTLGIWKTIIWNGATFTNGTGTSNAPGANDGYRKFIVRSSKATLPEDGKVEQMIIESGSGLHIPNGYEFTVHNKIENHDTVYLDENSSLVQTHSGTDQNEGLGRYRMKRTGLKTKLGYNSWSSPVDSADIIETFPSTNLCDIYFFDADNQLWTHDFLIGTQTTCNGNPVTFNHSNVKAGADGIFDAGYGYFVPGNVGADTTKTFTGKANNGIVSVKVYQQVNPNNVSWTGDDWNLVGNPYLSAISASKFWQENAINNPKIIGAIYYWDDDNSGGSGYDQNNDYASWNLMGGTAAGSGKIPNGYVSSGQGIWVIANQDADIIFNNSMRGGENSQFFKGNSDNPLNASRLWLSVETPENNSNQILIGFSDSATTGYDSQIDAFKMEGNPKLMFGSTIQGKNDPFIIQGVPFIPENQEYEIPLYIKTKDPGIHHFKMDRVEHFNEKYEYYIKDKTNGKIHNLKNGPFAAFLDKSGEYKNRFSITAVHKKDSTSTSVITRTPSKDQVFAFQRENQLVVNYKLQSSLKEIYVNNMNGVEVLRKSGAEKSGNIEFDVKNIPSGIYFVTVKSSTNTKVEKVILY